MVGSMFTATRYWTYSVCRKQQGKHFVSRVYGKIDPLDFESWGLACLGWWNCRHNWASVWIILHGKRLFPSTKHATWMRGLDMKDNQNLVLLYTFSFSFCKIFCSYFFGWASPQEIMREDSKSQRTCRFNVSVFLWIRKEQHHRLFVSFSI